MRFPPLLGLPLLLTILTSVSTLTHRAAAEEPGTPAPEFALPPQVSEPYNPPPPPPEPPFVPDEVPTAPEGLPDIVAEPMIPPAPELDTPNPDSPPAQSFTSIDDFDDPRVPRFTRQRPYLAFEFSGSLRAFKDRGALAGTQPIRAITGSIHIQPTFTQAMGIFSFGPAVSLYPFLPRLSATPSGFSIWGAGGQVQYQARYFREQILVPVVGYTAEMMQYKFSDGPKGQLTTKGPYFGLYLLLNALEPRAASDFFANHGVLRSYLVAELRNLEGTDANLTLGGSSVYFGFRIEH